MELNTAQFKTKTGIQQINGNQTKFENEIKTLWVLNIDQ